MLTTIDIPEEILSEAMRLAGTHSKTNAMVLSLQEFINRHKIGNLRKLRGLVDLDINLDALRRDRSET